MLESKAQASRMVVNRDIKRKRKVNTCINLLDDSPKRTKVHAQRKFAQGSNVSSPVITPVKEIEKQDRSRDVLPEPAELLPIKRPNTEDFLTFLCFRGTPILPASLNFFNTASMIDTRVQTDEPKHISPKNGPIITHNFNKSPNERPFIAFGVRKRADPVVISKQMDKKRRHALALQALRRKYQEQKMAKIRAVTISKLSEKITSKSVVRTRSVTKNETITKKNITQKIVTTRTTIKQPIRSKIKSKMCLRSFRGRYIHHELGVRTHKKKPLPTKRITKASQEKKQEERPLEKSSSEFSSDDDEPLVKTAKSKFPKPAEPRTAKKSAPGPKKPAEINYRLTRSHRMLLNNQLTTRKHAKFFTKSSGGMKSTNTKIINKKVIRSSRILKKRIVHNTSSIQNKIQTRRISQRTSKRLKPIFHEGPKRMPTRSEPRKEGAKQGSKIFVKKSVKSEQSSEPKEKYANKKEEPPKKTGTANEEPRKVIKDKVELDKKVLRKTEILKYNKDKCEGALKKVAIVKISKAESEKTNESEKLMAKKEETVKVNKEKEGGVSQPKKTDNKKSEEVDPKKEENSNVAKTKSEKINEQKKSGDGQKINKKEVDDGDKHNLRKTDSLKVTKVDGNDKIDKKKTTKETKDVVNDKIIKEKAEEEAGQGKANEEKMNLRKDKDKSKPEIVQQTVKTMSKIEEAPKISPSKKLEKSKKDELEKVETKIANSRPTRKTKEAAAIYMEILGHKLVNDAEIDDDDISIDSFPELPNVRKTEQRENELKAKAKFKVTDAEDNSAKKSKEASDKEQMDKIELKTRKGKDVVAEDTSPEIVQDQCNIVKAEEHIKEEKKENLGKRKSLIETEKTPSDLEDNLKKQKQLKKSVETEKTRQKKKAPNTPINIEKRQTRFQTTKPFPDMSFSDSDESFTIDMKICGTIETKQVRKKPVVTEKKAEAEQNKSLLTIKPANTSQVPRVLLTSQTNTPPVNEENNLIDDEDKSLVDSDNCSSVQARNKKKTKIYRMRKPLDQSFSDSDEEPLSKLTQAKGKKLEQTSKLSDKNKEVEEMQFAGKPKRECTKRPQNYLPLFSSSDDEEKYFHGFVKTETKTLKDIRNEEEKCVHSLPSDLLCKDIGRRFGKGKVNMSNEQIEKWLNDSALAGINVKKENDEMLKFGEKIPTETPDVKPKAKTDEPIKDELKPKAIPSPANSTIEKQPIDKPLAKSIPVERKTIFRKEKTQPIRNVNAFSASNESSVYAFQADTEDSISTPFRRPSRRPSSTATSKSEDEISKFDDVSKYAGKFRLPTTVKANSRPEVSVVVSTEDSNSASVPLQINVETTEVFPDVAIVHLDLEQKAPVKKESDEKFVKAKDKCSSSMFPPTNMMQRLKPEGKHTSKGSNNRSSDRLSETSEEFKYKIPSSPSASSSSSTKLYKRQKARYQPLELCTPVQVADFPGINCLAQMVEAPVFYPSEKEFQDPIEYIEKIRVRANKFGICRIVPPSNFKPECKVSDDMRFTAYNQYVHKMLHRWGPNFKELMAIKKYLQTQNITLTHPPWIGGMEIDLPRLYQTVQLLGGLKEVIEKKKWPKVSEAMKIPKSAQDRLTKLDDIYCKYLLPYDTLSPAEREKLFDEVETEWAKRESKTLLKVQQKMNRSETASESDSDPEDESEECIVKGRNMALNAFYRIARNTMSMWFKTPEPPAEEVEQEFWKHVTLKNNHICVHSGSIDSGNWGYGFAVSKNSPFARHAWNLKVLTNNSGSVLRCMGPLMGVTVPTLHVGMVFSACCWYRDPHSLPWIEYLHTGANKIWYGIPDSMSECFHSTLLKLVPNYCKNKSLWLPSDTVMIPPNLLVENGMSLSRTVQEPGQFIVVFPKVFTSSISTGYVVSESVYFAPPYWLESAQKVFEELKNSCEPSMFSLDRLLLSVSLDPRSNVDVLRQIIPAVQNICDRERKFRRKLTDLGLSANEKLPLPEAPAIRKRKKLQDDNGDYECETCHTNLFISLVAESQEDVVYCLEHASNQIEAKKIEVKNCKLMFTYDGAELDQLIERIKSTIEAKLQKKLPGKYSNLPTMLK